MFNYMTVEETAVKWHMSAQYVQGLCRKGAIQGAIKKGTMWFIPSEAENPDQHIDQPFQYRGTKKAIFENAARLFAERSYEVVTLKDIADEVGIAQSAIYRHFGSKRELLDAIYAHFSHHHLADRPALEEIEARVPTMTHEELIACCGFQYAPDHRELMLACLRIICQRMPVDACAGEVFRLQVLESSMQYAQRIYDKAKEMGRLSGTEPHLLAVYFGMVRSFELVQWLLYADQEQQAAFDEWKRAFDAVVLKGLRPAKEA